MAKKYQRPYTAGWEKLSIEERIENWLGMNKPELGAKADDFGNFLRNFSACHDRLNAESWNQLLYDLRDRENPSLEFWKKGEKGRVFEGVLAMYNVTPCLLEIAVFRVKGREYLNN